MIRLFSPAKINLFLQVCGKRADGYHLLETLMQAVSLGDWLQVRFAATDSLEISGASLSAGRDNLIWRAVDLFRLKCQIDQPVAIALEKKIPMQAGLGGGSGNAATALWAMNELSGRPATLSQLQSWSAEIGADVPFFFSHGTAFCTGTGTEVEDIASLPKRSIWIMKPEESLSTPSVYGALDLEGATRSDPRALVDRFVAGELPLQNDLQSAAFRLAPRLAALHTELGSYGPLLLAGSGSSLVLFGSAPSQGVGEWYRACFVGREEGRWYEPTG